MLNEVPDIDFNGMPGNPHDILDTLELDTIDMIGIPGVDPGNQGFTVGSGTTKDENLRRSPMVTRGVSDWDCGQMQWSVNGIDNISDLKQHQNICSACYSFNDLESAWYIKGEKETWSQQEDVYVFRLTNKQAFTEQLDMSIVDSIVFYNVTGLKYNLIYFNPSSTPSDRQMIKEYVRNNILFEFEFPVVTKYPSDDMTEKKWFISNDIIKVVFWDNDPSQTFIQTLMDNHDLFLSHAPDPQLPKAGNSSWTYAFGINPTGCKTRNAINVAAEIFEQENNIVKIAAPWIEPVASFCSTNDEYFNASWHIKNTAQCLGMSPSGNGTNNADCDIEEAWNEGYTGSGIKVAVIDKGLYDTSHPDMSGKFLGGWDCVDNDSDVSSSSVTCGPPYPACLAHPMACAGLIGAVADNSIGSVGVAYDAQIVPYISWMGNSYNAFQKAFAAEVDIISCSWGWDGWYEEDIENEIHKCRTQGRDGKGIVILCAAGNSGNNTTTVFPAYLDDVIGIIASEQNDNKANFSNYGSEFDVAAPGTHYITTDLIGDDGFNPLLTSYTHNGCTSSNLDKNYAYFDGTSGATPIAAGVCALILQANQDLTATNVQTILENTADKVGVYPDSTPYDYNAVSQGRSMEMGYGRINAYAAVQDASGISENNDNVYFFSAYPNPANNTTTINFSLSSTDDVLVEIYDFTGRRITTVFKAENLLPSHLYSTNIETNSFSNGVYFVVLKSQSSVQTIKLSIIKK